MSAGAFISSSVSPGDTRDVSGACPSSTTPDSPLSIGPIAGGIAGGVVLLAILIFIFHRLLRKKPIRLVEPPINKPHFQPLAHHPFSHYDGDMNGPPPVTPPIRRRPSNFVAPPPQPHPGNLFHYYGGDMNGPHPVTPPVQRRPSNVVAPPPQPHPIQVASVEPGQPPPYTADPVYITTADNSTSTSGSWKRYHAHTSASPDNTPWDG